MSETINNETENTNFQLTWGSESTKSWFDITTDAYILVKRTIATIGWSCNKTISQKKKKWRSNIRILCTIQWLHKKIDNTPK